MRQKVEDLKLLPQRDRKAQVIAICVLFGILYLIFGGQKKSLQPPQYAGGATRIPAGSGAMGNEEAYRDIVARFSKDLQELKTESHENAMSIQRQGESMKEYETRTAEIFKRILERIAETEQAVTTAKTSGDRSEPVDLGDERIAAENEDADTLESFGNEPGPVAPPPMAAPKKYAVIGMGDSVRVKLLAGVNAPTDGTPYPVVFKLVGDVAGPDGSSLPLGEARLVAAAQGSLPDSRALFRITALNIRLPDGRRKFLPVDGWIVGEDGIRGMEGILIDPIGKGIAGGAMVGALQGLGQAISDSQTTTYNTFYGTEEIVTGDDAEYAAGKAVSGAARQWGSILRDRLSLLTPHVQVLSGREATAVFSKAITIPDLFEALEVEQDVFATLD